MIQALTDTTGKRQHSSLGHQAVMLLKKLISTPSHSGDEFETADIIQAYLENHDITTHRLHNNVWAFNRHFDKSKPTILLNSHHDTVKPNGAYTKNPYFAQVIDGKLYGLGSNDAGGCLVSLMATFVHFYNERDLSYNLCLVASAEEENSGKHGLSEVLPNLGELSFAIVGEPTQMQMATAEMGNMVLDCTCYGVAGHAARNEGTNALYKALTDINWFANYHFPKQSAFMGPVKMTVTQIDAGMQHNIIPHECHFTVDVRLSDCYKPTEVLDIIKQNTTCSVCAREGVLTASCIDSIHPIVRTGAAMGLRSYVSPTSSDQGWLSIPSLKIGPGDSARSHMADEYIYLDEIHQGIDTYINLLNGMIYCLLNNPR